MDEIKREKGFVVVDAESNCMNGQTEFFLSRGEAEEYIGEQVAKVTQVEPAPFSRPVFYLVPITRFTG